MVKQIVQNYQSCLKRITGIFPSLMMVFLVLACLPGDQSSQTGSAEDFIQQRQSTAVSYARSFQQYAALSQQALINDIWEGGISLPASGLIDMGQFASQYSLGNTDAYLQSGICETGSNQYHLTWFRGEQSSTGGVNSSEQLALKGLGSGFGPVLSILSREMSPSSYGVYKQGRVYMAAGNIEVLNCPVISNIPQGSPVILTSVGQPDTSNEETFFEYQTVQCGEDQTGQTRQRRSVTRVLDEDGNEISQEVGDWTSFVTTCLDEINTPTISADASQTSQTIDFASAGLLNTVDEECFTAEVTRTVDSSGSPIPKDQQVPETITNCVGAGSGSVGGTPIPFMDCDYTTPIRTDTQIAICPSGYSGSITYIRPVYQCELKYSDPSTTPATITATGQYIEQYGDWEDGSISCSASENRGFTCPSVASAWGAIQPTSEREALYTRTNTITDFSLQPNNPDWSYSTNDCLAAFNVVAGSHERYVGNDLAIPTIVNGNTISTNIGDHLAPIVSLCEGSGAGSGGGGGGKGGGGFAAAAATVTVATESRSGVATCPAGTSGAPTETRQYRCSSETAGAWTAWTADTSVCVPVSCSAPLRQWENVTFTCPDGSPQVRSRFRDKGPAPACAWGSWSSPIYSPPTCPTSGGGGGSSECTSGDTETRPVTCPVGQEGEKIETRWCTNGNWGGWTVTTNTCAVPPACTPYATEDRTVSCPAGQIGTRNQRRTCSISSTWGAWATISSNCQVAECTPGASETRTASCPPNHTGNGSEIRYCQSNSTWGSWQDNPSGSTCQAIQPTWVRIVPDMPANTCAHNGVLGPPIMPIPTLDCGETSAFGGTGSDCSTLNLQCKEFVSSSGDLCGGGFRIDNYDIYECRY